jgi:tetratricopeptide (TPR) repeat protein
MTQLNAFVARSFAPKDGERIQPLLNFLDTFRDAGFFWHTAERAEVESVSQKVRRMIDEANVFIGFFTRRYPVISLEATLADACRVLLGRIRPDRWSAPAWVLQESGYALHGGKELILLKEPDVEVFGLQGDLEYIQFDPENPSAVFSTLSQMINGLLAKAAGTAVRVTVEQGQKPSQEATGPAVQIPSEAPESDTKEPDITERFYEMWEAARAHDFPKMDEAWNAGSDLIVKGKAKEIDKLTWDCIYFEGRFSAGVADALDQLKRLRADHPDRPEPIRGLARCYDGSKEFDISSRLFLEAASLQQGDSKVRSLLKAADAFRQVRRFEQAKEIIAEALSIATTGLRDEALSMHYRILKENGEEYLAFGVAEAALHDNPQFPLRFTLALDFRRKSLNELALYHFKFLHEHNDKDASSLHNLALMYADCKLPVTAVDHYKASFALGETLSASNLGFMYLDCGMAEEAKLLIEKAMAFDNHDSRVEKCLAEIIGRREQESETEANLLKQAGDNRSFLVSMGQALSVEVPDIGGRWKFPFGEMSLTMVSNAVRGTLDITRTEGGFAGVLFGIGGGSPTVKTDTHAFEGKMRGAVCEYVITIAEKGLPDPIRALIGSSNAKSGFIVFEPDGKSGAYVELSGGKLGKIEVLNKLD